MNPFLNNVASPDTIELMSKFFEAASDAVERAQYDDDILEAFDLVQAISCYRYFPSVEKCIEAFPTLAQEQHKVEYIWEQFNSLSSEQLSDIYIKSLSKISLTDTIAA